MQTDISSSNTAAWYSPARRLRRPWPVLKVSLGRLHAPDHRQQLRAMASRERWPGGLISLATVAQTCRNPIDGAPRDRSLCLGRLPLANSLDLRSQRCGHLID